MLPFGTSLYYRLKPFLPWRLRMAARRWHARRVLKRSGDIWPIDPVAAIKPDGWPGWPDGKQFAFVLTHDVEGPAGLAKVRPLAELEMSLGFRSCFNFIPEGPYRVPPELRAWLVENGFEVGVHDLHHDGRLYRNRDHFSRCAEKINGYLADWNAVGFRPGFMLRHLDWLKDLDILWDSSTFDTDPFEPQPDGVRTLFPFWVSSADQESKTLDQRPKTIDQGSETIDHRPKTIDHRPKTIDQRPETGDQGAGAGDRREETGDRGFGGREGRRDGYIELPYTLPQDSTLFFVLREKSPAIWFRKLDWIAQHGGMALVNVHPDYLCFPGERNDAQNFQLDLYKQLLEYVRERHSGAYWHSLPQDVAVRVRQMVKPDELRAPGRVTATIPSRVPQRKIWIDLENTPHIPFFRPIIRELEKRGYRVVITARDAYQTCEMAEHYGLAFTRVGHHYGKHKLLKAWGFFVRSAQLVPFAMREREVILNLVEIEEWLLAW